MESRPETVLAIWRKEQDLMVKDAAAKVDVTPAMWSRWETGARSVPVSRCADLEKKLGIPRSELRPDIFAGLTSENAA